MIISVKDSLKFFGVTIVCFCAVFVCTFFLNYYIDVLPLRDSVSEDVMPLYKAQLAMAKMTCSITGGFLSVIAVIMILFYIKMYTDGHRKALGTFKAMGYSNLKIANSFLIFGLSAFIGCGAGFAIGWAFIPIIYKGLTINGLPVVNPEFHTSLLICLVFVPSAVFTAVAYVYAALTLRKPALQLLRGDTEKVKKVKPSAKDRPFLTEMCLSTLKSKKMLAFFATFSCFCFAAMVQMGLSMEDLVEGTMGSMILAIGLVLAAVSMFMAMTSLVAGNAKNTALMKAMGFSLKERFTAIFFPYIPLAVLGFAIGSAYQYGLLSVMINVVFRDVGEVPEYGFNVPVFFITLALFTVCYGATFAFYLYKSNKATIKDTFTE